MSLLFVALFTSLLTMFDRATDAVRRRGHSARSSSGQATAEYALVLLGAAALALLLAAWAAKSGKVGQLFDAVVDRLISDAK